MKKTFITKLFTTKVGIAALTGTVALGGIVTYGTLSTGVLEDASEKTALVEKVTTEDQNTNDSADTSKENSSTEDTEIFEAEDEQVEVADEGDSETPSETEETGSKVTSSVTNSTNSSSTSGSGSQTDSQETNTSTKPTTGGSKTPTAPSDGSDTSDSGGDSDSKEESKSPSTPTQPEEPSQPTEPTQPEEPSQPTEPTQPEEPSQPTEPTQPEEPSEPTEPTQPEEPSEPVEEGNLGVFTASEELPSWTTNKNISILHSSQSYWNWAVQDKNYIDSLANNLTPEVKQQLFSELFTLQTAYNSNLDNYVSVNGFRFYPTTSVGVLDTLGRGIKARYTAIYNTGSYSYPAVGKGGIVDVGHSTTMTSNNSNNGIYETDKELYNVLLDFPYNAMVYNNMPVFNMPFSFTDGSTATVPTGRDEILFAGHLGDGKNIFYHELGHVFDNLYQPNEADYLAIRGKTVSEGYATSFVENFAEDFRYTKYPYSTEKLNSITSFGNPSEEEMEQLKTFYNNLEKSKSPSVRSMQVNGKFVLNDVVVTTSNKVSFSGQGVSGNITVLDPDGNTTYISSSGSFTMEEEGAYEFRTPYGKYVVVYDTDQTLNTQPDSIHEDVQISSLSGNAYHWAQDTQYSKGVFAYDKEDFFIMISTGQNGTFGIDNVFVENGKVVVTLETGTKQTAVFRLPTEYQDMPIELRGQTQGIEDDTILADMTFNYDYANMAYSKDQGIVLSGKARSGTGTVYYEVKDSNGNVLDSNNIMLWSAAPHFSTFKEFILPETYPAGETTVTFYENSNKTKQLGHIQFTVTEPVSVEDSYVMAASVPSAPAEEPISEDNSTQTEVVARQEETEAQTEVVTEETEPTPEPTVEPTVVETEPTVTEEVVVTEETVQEEVVAEEQPTETPVEETPAP